MTRAQEMIHDHVAPRKDLDRVLRDTRDLFRAVLGEASPYAGQAHDLTGRVDCYKRGHDGLLAAQQIVHQGLGGAHVERLPQEHPRTEAEMKKQAHAGIRVARAIAARYGLSLDRTT
jgi:hypothetical protein